MSIKNIFLVVLTAVFALLFVTTLFAEEAFYNYGYLEKYLEKKHKSDVSAVQTLPSDVKIEYNNSEWNTMRKGLEKGYKPGEYIIKENLPAEQKAKEEKEKTEPESVLSLDLPYESGLSIKGLKTIDLKYSYKKYDKDQTANSRQNQTKEFDMDQSLVVNIKGKVGRKITVNVDFDDTKELEQKRDISVV
jgi:hypothetical protein